MNNCPNCNYYLSGKQFSQPNNNQINGNLEQVINYGIQEAQYVGVPHAIREVAFISYLMGTGVDMKVAHQMAESLETNEKFPR